MASLKTILAGLVVALTAVPAVAASVAHPAAQTVRMEPFNGAFVIPVVLNNVLTENFIIDSGAADVSIPAEVAFRLKQLGALTGADFLGSKTYMMADGSKVPSEIYRIASLRIGDMVMKDVTVRISAEKSHLLLGQSFLSRLKSWSMDNGRQVMTFN
ncbi:MAG TPA: retropepsin-like aspartic protease [Rhizomicrobium sp.]|nr:retropepsin-like aspartic protease [Rhizomicrobium sp.]